jgi:hypothetical protein
VGVMESDYGCVCERSRNNALPGGGKGVRQVRSRMRLQGEQKRRTNWRWRGSAMDSDYKCDYKWSKDHALAAGRGSVMGSDHICDCKESRGNPHSRGRHDWVRSQMRLQR